MIVALLLACSGPADTASQCVEDSGGGHPTWSNFGEAFFLTYCDACHAADSPNRFDAPLNVTFDTEAEAVRIANDTPYGLTNYVQSQDGPRRNRLARQLRAGMIEMNGKSRGAGAPFGGVKASGRAREGGHWGIEEFLEVKAISGWDSAADIAAE